MEIGDMLVGIVVFSMMTMAFAGMYLELAENPDYGMASPQNLTAFSRTVTSINTTLKSIETEFKAEQPSTIAYYPLIAPFVAVRMFFGVGTMASSLVADVSTLGDTATGGPFMPPWFVAGITTIIMILITIAILAALLGRRP